MSRSNENTDIMSYYGGHSPTLSFPLPLLQEEDTKGGKGLPEEAEEEKKEENWAGGDEGEEEEDEEVGTDETEDAEPRLSLQLSELLPLHALSLRAWWAQACSTQRGGTQTVIRTSHQNQSSDPVIKPSHQNQTSEPVIRPSHPTQSSEPVIRTSHQANI